MYLWYIAQDQFQNVLNWCLIYFKLFLNTKFQKTNFQTLQCCKYYSNNKLIELIIFTITIYLPTSANSISDMYNVRRKYLHDTIWIHESIIFIPFQEWCFPNITISHYNCCEGLFHHVSISRFCFENYFSKNTLFTLAVRYGSLKICLTLMSVLSLIGNFYTNSEQQNNFGFSYQYLSVFLSQHNKKQ